MLLLKIISVFPFESRCSIKLLSTMLPGDNELPIKCDGGPSREPRLYPYLLVRKSKKLLSLPAEVVSEDA